MIVDIGTNTVTVEKGESVIIKCKGWFTVFRICNTGTEVKIADGAGDYIGDEEPTTPDPFEPT